MTSAELQQINAIANRVLRELGERIAALEKRVHQLEGARPNLQVPYLGGFAAPSTEADQAAPWPNTVC